MGIEREAGNGRADIIMRRNDPRYPNIVVELKKSRSDDPEDLERMAEEGLRQIRTREYYRSLKGEDIPLRSVSPEQEGEGPVRGDGPLRPFFRPHPTKHF
ncbi:PD-(D/E)XK nuclease domain-containing protein [Methanomethylophilus alvi]|uniref:PD-(D/E)XK nuclease domain-containing protein n=1 Tax=Methanomethylophilus alvi TaxID=1291540 RepID=UPI0037DDA923